MDEHLAGDRLERGAVLHQVGRVVTALKITEVEPEPAPEVEVFLDRAVELGVAAASREAGQLRHVGEGRDVPGHRGRDRCGLPERGQLRGTGEERPGRGRGRRKGQVDGREDLPDRLQRYRVGPRQRPRRLPDGAEQVARQVALGAGVDLPRHGSTAGRAEELDGRAQRPPPRPERGRFRADGVSRWPCSVEPPIPGAPAMMKVGCPSKTLGVRPGVRFRAPSAPDAAGRRGWGGRSRPGGGRARAGRPRLGRQVGLAPTAAIPTQGPVPTRYGGGSSGSSAPTCWAPGEPRRAR